MAEEKKRTITCCIVTKNEEFMLPMCLNSAVTFADEIIIVDDMSTDRTKQVAEMFQKDYPDIKIKFIEYKSNMHCSAQRQKAIENSTCDWIFWLDADEAVGDDFKKELHKALDNADSQKVDVIDIQYIHFVHDFAHVDASESVHLGLVRLHKNYDDLNVYDKKHPFHILPNSNSFRNRMIFPSLIIYHCGYLMGMPKIYERYKRNVRYSQLHVPIQQMYWRDWHYDGSYPKKAFNMQLIPKVIKEHFDIRVYDHDTCQSIEKNPFWKLDNNGK